MFEELTVPEKILDQFHRSVDDLMDAPSFSRDIYTPKVMAAVHRLAETPEGIRYLYHHSRDLHEAGLFKGSTWDDPRSLVPSLVSGTLKTGGETTNYEILSELRMLAIANGEIDHSQVDAGQARSFIQKVLANNLDVLFPDQSEEARKLDSETWIKMQNLFQFLVKEIPFTGIIPTLLEEVEMICAQRPVITDRANKILKFIHENISLDLSKHSDRELQGYLNALYAPTSYLQSESGLSPAEYADYLLKADREQVKTECREMGQIMLDTGLVSPYHPVLLEYISDNPVRLKEALALNKSGRAELDEHRTMFGELVQSVLYNATARCIYGLGRLLEHNLLSHQPVYTGLKRLLNLKLHPAVQENILRSSTAGRLTNPDPQKLLIADTISILGQPLGVGQGWNPTCQSARGISLWSQHAPGKMVRMIITAATENNLSMRFEGQVIQSDELTEGLAKEFDYHLDIVSIVLVPHLDKIYNDMMRRCALRLDDGHRWVNPAMYGHWIPTGFISAYDVATNTIKNYREFVRIFYVTHHPEFNGGHDLAYPNPVGIFITSSTGKLLGFHAVSILRVAPDDDQMRIYFLNPNNEGRQSWGPDIQPTVAGHGERHGESSLPFFQFASRLYAFHYNQSEAKDPNIIPGERIDQIEAEARESWGQSYTWS